jgi:SAM-dependent methyltransferase
MPGEKGAELGIKDLVRRHRGLDPRMWLQRLTSFRRREQHRADWERSYAGRDDPYGYELGGYDLDRYERLLGMLGDRRFGRGLDMGCSVGVLSELLAPRCDELVAVDISEAAVVRARERLSDHRHVTVERRTLPAEIPEGPFDLIVCADVAEYWDRGSWIGAIRSIEERLSPGGVLLASFWRPYTRSHVQPGDAAAATLRRRSSLRRVAGWIGPKHRLERYDAQPAKSPAG